MIGLNFKKTLVVVLVPFLAIVFVQWGLLYPKTRELFTGIETKEGIAYTPLTETNTRYIELTLEEGTPEGEIMILFNSRCVARFTQKTVIVPVECDGVFEIINGNDYNLTVAARCDSADITHINNVIPKGIHTLCSVHL